MLWKVTHLGGYAYLAQRKVGDNIETVYLNSHCLQCAKVDLLAKHGGRVDLRGSHSTPDGLFLRAVQAAVIEEENESNRMA